MPTILEWLKLWDEEIWHRGHLHGMTSLLNFMKIYHLVQQLLVQDTQTAW
jgi:hypothetical protein